MANKQAEFEVSLIAKLLQDPLNLCTETELREQLSCAKKAFQVADTDDSGYLTLEEISRLCEEMGIKTYENGENMLDSMDKDDSEQVELNEWLDWWLNHVSRIPNPAKQQEVIARNVFAKYDVEGNGLLDINEFGELLSSLGADFNENDMKIALSEIDSSQNGQIDINEFLDWWCNRAKKNRQASNLVSLKLKQLAKKAIQIYSTDIFTSVWKGDVALVKAFVASDHRNSIASDNSDYGNGWTPLHYASYRGHLEIVEYLLQQSCMTISMINKGNDHGFTPLFYACQCGHITICELLLSRGADPSICGVDPSIVSNQSTWLCAASFCTIYPQLHNLIDQYIKCPPPTMIPSTKISGRVISPNKLAIDLPNQRSYSAMPVDTFHVNVFYENSKDLKMTLKSNSPNENQSLDGTIDKQWVIQMIQYCITNNTMSSVMMTIKPIDVMNNHGPDSESVILDVSSVVKDYQTRSMKQRSSIQSESNTATDSKSSKLSSKDRK